MSHRYLWSLSIMLGLAHGGPVCARKTAGPTVAATVTGRVVLDVNGNGVVDAGDRGLANVRVTDGMKMVRTGADGSYTLTFADDPLIPYRPSQVLSVCWPSGTWPVGRRFFVRRADIKPMQIVDFLLREQKQTLPFTFVHGTDPHDNLACARDAFGDDIQRMSKRVQFCLMSGDLGYASWEGADSSFAAMRTITSRFPVPMLHTCGNHDIVGIHTTRWSEQSPTAGYGPYTKYLGPIRYSFDYAGVHFVGLDWARIMGDGKMQTGVPDTAIAWLKKDLADLKPGTRIFVYMHHHFRHGDDRFWDVLAAHKVELLLAGHSHRNKESSRRGVEWLTTQNLCGPYRLVTVHAKGHTIVNRCYAGSGAGHHHSYAGKCKMALSAAAFTSKHGLHREIANRTLDSAQAIEDFRAGQMEIVAEIDPGTAKKLGIRLRAKETRSELTLDGAANEVQFGAIRSGAVRGRGDRTFRVRMIVTAGKCVVYVNNRVQMEQPLVLKQLCSVELFADGGRAVFRKVDVWEIR